MKEQEYLTVAEAAARIKVQPNFVYIACAARGLKHIKLGGKRSIRIRPQDLDAFMTEHEVN